MRKKFNLKLSLGLVPLWSLYPVLFLARMSLPSLQGRGAFRILNHLLLYKSLVIGEAKIQTSRCHLSTPSKLTRVQHLCTLYPTPLSYQGLLSTWWTMQGSNITHTPKDGDCLYHSCRVAMDLPQEYVPQLMKRQIIVFMAQNAKVCSEIFNPTIQGTYGNSKMDPEEYESLKKANALTPKQIEKQETPGPFSYLTYLRHQLKEGSWGDEIMVAAMSMMWQISITILYAETITEHRVRHDRLIGKVDMVVIFCDGCHYIGASEYLCHFCLFYVSVWLACTAVRLPLTAVKLTLKDVWLQITIFS